MWRDFLDSLREYAGIALEHAAMWREYLAAARGYLATWRDYLPHAGTAVAIVNGLLVVAVALLPFKNQRTKLRIGIFALVLAVIAIGATAYTQYSAYRLAEQQREARRDTRDKLLALAAEGAALLTEISDRHRPLPVRQADDWAQRSESLVGERLGASAVERFRSEVANRPGEASAVGQDRMGYWRAVRNRVIHLERMAAEQPL